MKFIKVTDFDSDSKTLIPVDRIVSMREDFLTGPRTEQLVTVIRLMNKDEISVYETLDEIQKLIEQ